MQLKKISLIMAILSGLSACGTTPNSTQKTVSTQTQVNTAPVVQDMDAVALLARALEKDGATRIQLLYNAREAAITEQNWQVLEQACIELESKASVDHVQNKLYVALARKELGKYESAHEILQSVNEKLKLSEHKAWHQYLKGSIFASQKLPKKALVHYFQSADIAQQNTLAIAGLDAEIWAALQQLSSYALERFDRGSVIQQGWVKLAKYHQVYLGSTVQLHQAMNNWQRRYKNHPGSFIIPTKVKSDINLAPYEATKLAILLPQSGNSERLGAALKNGFLAAMDRSKISEIHFIDEMDSAELIERSLQEIQADFIIGPLLKSNVVKVKRSGFITSSPAIFLNEVDASEADRVHSEHFYFALNPEHEVEQAMVHFLAKGYQKPMLLAPDTPAGKRLIAHFEQQWQTFSETTPEVGFYSNTEDMVKVITELLEVDSSKTRIKEVRNLFRSEVESETRSRRDLDAIYILGDAIETRLLKPYLDVNVSTFAERIPLYASSRSYSKQIDKTDKGDLEGLYFTELPWMLPDAVNERNLRDTYSRLWPEQADIEQRLFAMAYDALNLIPELKQLSRIPGKEFEGLTGALSIKEANQIHRKLIWAQYHKNKIRLVSLDERPPTPLFMQNTE
ncbi:penicillin-binding protein activator [Pseudoalteromonas luteoviolacea]|uniref:penicillin-binding protein activator n=1 Tax=Pseudoalteromonas luteoviolacea TaxID=43657 RepID=UPI00114DD016|nr:penicillin-binding protein activator [Pseudoalteromonas luteoviolacea]TQF72243.1 penicillin-binding protein activator [Pseudoalteromonas luteoviolacea]